jgi:hypothetical protein
MQNNRMMTLDQNGDRRIDARAHPVSARREVECHMFETKLPFREWLHRH